MLRKVQKLYFYSKLWVSCKIRLLSSLSGYKEAKSRRKPPLLISFDLFASVCLRKLRPTKRFLAKPKNRSKKWRRLYFDNFLLFAQHQFLNSWLVYKHLVVGDNLLIYKKNNQKVGDCLGFFTSKTKSVQKSLNFAALNVKLKWSNE